MDRQDFVDLGLPSGTLWAAQNCLGFFTFNDAKEQFGDSLPSPKMFKELFSKCKVSWDIKRKGITFVGPNGNELYIPASGYHAGQSFHGMYYGGKLGYYWSNRRVTARSTNALCFSYNSFNSRLDNDIHGMENSFEFPVRLVKAKAS